MGRSMPARARTGVTGGLVPILASALIGAVLGLSAVPGASAQGAAPEAPGADPGDPVTPRQKNAARLAGLSGFVDVACPALRTDRARLEAAIGAMGVEPAELEQGVMRLRAQAYLEAYRRDEAASCTRAAELFGAGGRIAPGVFVPR